MKNVLLVFLALLILSSCRKKEEKVEVQSVTINQGTTASLRLGDPALRLTAAVLPENATSRAVTWTSSDPSIATVSEGLVTAVKDGETIISAQAGDVTAHCTVTVLPALVAVAGISLNPTAVSIAIGQISALEATFTPENATDKSIVWSSNNEAIASVSNGFIKGVAVGACLITAKSFSDQTKAATCEVTVVEKEIAVTGISLDQNAATLLVTGTRQLRATIAPENATNKNVRWSVSNAAVAEVSTTGLVTAKTVGTATLTAASAANPDKTAVCAITVTDREIAVTGLTLIPADTTVAVGTIFQLKHKVEPANSTNVNVTFESGDETKAIVSESGLVTVRASTGSAAITVKSVADPTKMATCRLTIKPRVQRIIVAPDAVSLSVGQKRQLTATVSPSDAAHQTVTWSSADELKATVSAGGEVTAVAPGSVRITATAKDGSLVTGSSLITVLPADIPVTGISLNATVANILVNGSRQLRAIFAPENATNKNVTWATSDASVAEVSSTGSVTAKTVGTTTVTATSVANPAKTAVCLITVTTKEVAVTGLTAAPADTTISVGAGFQLRYSIAPVNATNVNVTYESSDAAKAGVSITGLVTAQAIGEATITVKSVANPAKTGTCRVTVRGRVQSIAVTPATAILATGQKQRLTATVLPDEAATKTVKWSSADQSKATVNSEGEVTAVAPGEVRITATARDGSLVAGSSVITIVSQAASVTVSAPASAGTPPSIAVGAEVPLKAVVLPADAPQTVTWSSGDTGKATVSPLGMVRGVATGNVTITATATDGSRVRGSLNVTIVTRAASITISAPPSVGTPPSILTEGSVRLTARVLPADAVQSVIWSSGDANKAIVSSLGVVTGVSAGNVNIIATAGDGSGITGTYSLTIITRTASLTITPANPVVGLGKTTTLTAQVTPAGAGRTVTWTSSDESKATINASGVVTGLALGSTVITAAATDGSGVTTTATLYVKNSDASISSITLGVERFPVLPLPAAGGTATIANIPRTIAEGAGTMRGEGIGNVRVYITTGAAEATIKIGSRAFTSGQTCSFLYPVTFTVTAPDGITVKQYTVAVTPYHATTNPYGIYTLAHLHDVHNNLTAGYKLMNDLTLPAAGSGFSGINDYATGGWVPLGSDEIPFSGSMDGGGHRIDNLYTNRKATSVGLFGKIQNGSLKNLTVNGATGTLAAIGLNSHSNKFVGILAGYCLGTIENCHASGNVSAAGEGGIELIAAAGGLAGYCMDATVTDCSASGEVTISTKNDTDAYGGGLVGYCDGNISNSFATGSVTTATAATITSSAAGGLLGLCWKGSITKCYATGKASAASASNVDYSGAMSGGLVGYCSKASAIHINDCFATGEVFTSCVERWALGGGLVGYCNSNNTNITNSYATGNVSSEYNTGYYSVGGVLGYNQGSTVTNSYRNSNASLRKGNAAATSLGNEGTAKPLAEMKTAAFRDLLNGSTGNAWGHSSGKNNDLPYITGVGVGR